MEKYRKRTSSAPLTRTSNKNEVRFGDDIYYTAYDTSDDTSDDTEVEIIPQKGSTDEKRNIQTRKESKKKQKKENTIRKTSRTEEKRNIQKINKKKVPKPVSGDIYKKKVRFGDDTYDTSDDTLPSPRMLQPPPPPKPKLPVSDDIYEVAIVPQKGCTEEKRNIETSKESKKKEKKDKTSRCTIH